MKSRPVHKPISKVLTSRTLLVFVEMFPSTFKLQLSPIISSTTSYTRRENKASKLEYSMTGKTGTGRGKSLARWFERDGRETIMEQRWNQGEKQRVAGIFASGKFSRGGFQDFVRGRDESLVKSRARRRFRQLSVPNFPFIKRNLETSSFVPTSSQLAFASTRNYETAIRSQKFFLPSLKTSRQSWFPKFLKFTNKQIEQNDLVKRLERKSKLERRFSRIASRDNSTSREKGEGQERFLENAPLWGGLMRLLFRVRTLERVVGCG